MNGQEAQPENAIGEFLLEDYKLKTDFLKTQFERLWKRFELFLVIESALFAFFFKFLLTGEGEPLRANAWLFGVLGLVSSLLGLLFGAQDRYLVRSYREAVRRAGEQLKSYYSGTFTLPEWTKGYVAVGEPKVDLPPGVREGERPIDFRSALEWRTNFASTTTLPAWFALAVSLLWLLTLLLFS